MCQQSDYWWAKTGSSYIILYFLPSLSHFWPQFQRTAHMGLCVKHFTFAFFSEAIPAKDFNCHLSEGFVYGKAFLHID